jgi:hypothetical protein
LLQNLSYTRHHALLQHVKILNSFHISIDLDL